MFKNSDFSGSLLKYTHSQKDLFFLLPVRQRLIGEKDVLAALTNIQRVFLAFGDVIEFSVASAKSRTPVLFKMKPTQALEERFHALTESRFRCFPLKFDFTPPVSQLLVGGLFGDLSSGFRSKEFQLLFLNQRCITSSCLSAYITDMFAHVSKIVSGGECKQHPVYVLFFRCPLNQCYLLRQCGKSTPAAEFVDMSEVLLQTFKVIRDSVIASYPAFSAQLAVHLEHFNPAATRQSTSSEYTTTDHPERTDAQARPDHELSFEKTGWFRPLSIRAVSSGPLIKPQPPSIPESRSVSTPDIHARCSESVYDTVAGVLSLYPRGVSDISSYSTATLGISPQWDFVETFSGIPIPTLGQSPVPTFRLSIPRARSQLTTSGGTVAAFAASRPELADLQAASAQRFEPPRESAIVSLECGTHLSAPAVAKYVPEEKCACMPPQEIRRMRAIAQFDKKFIIARFNDML